MQDYAELCKAFSTPQDLLRRAADSIATRIPPSPLGGLEGRRTAGPEDLNFPTTLEVLGYPKHIKFVANWMAGGLQDWRIGRVGSIVRIGRIMEYLPSYTIGGLQHWLEALRGLGGSEDWKDWDEWEDWKNCMLRDWGLQDGDCGLGIRN